MNTSPLLGGHFFQRTRTIFKHNRAIIEKNVRTTFDKYWNINMTSRGLTKFYYSHIRKTSPPLAAMLLKKQTHVLTKFHKVWNKNKTDRVFTRFYHSHLTISAPPSGDHVCQLTIFKLS
ncbi:hypothetical protein DPMN_193386 [Dreissena polymorpha]|uniref:Uncharacterized protein n=1 Tax=Dreissena polymorpha TaxID=45954 RepID=A0A9D3Y735_DREPO|nr:hypothetical protein DPMN_193386 [Dreissena polymorpha]